MSPPKTFIVGISGLSCTGKTTLSRLLRAIFPCSFILHQDDFFHLDSSIPVRAGGLQDWDCVDAINWPLMSSALERARESGTLPADLKSHQDTSPVGPEVASTGCIDRVRALVAASGLDENVRIAFVDGFLLLHEDSTVEEHMDVKMLLQVPYETAKRRRASRTGYVTLEGFWTDPPGYFDQIVWPNYVKEHAYLFVDGDVEGRLKPEVKEQRRIHIPDSLDASAEETLEWAVNILINELKGQI